MLRTVNTAFRKFSALVRASQTPTTSMGSERISPVMQLFNDEGRFLPPKTLKSLCRDLRAAPGFLDVFPGAAQTAAAVTFLLAISTPGLGGDTTSDDGPVDFAPGATGNITAPITSILRDAEVNGESLKKQLTPQSAANDAFNTIDFDRLREDAITNVRARALLGIDETQGRMAADPQQERYEGKGVFLLASFSMPAPSLRQMMQEAERFGVPIVFRGFVNNSVYETQTLLEKTFGHLDDAVGFSIDPTLFTRFRVDAVPYVIATDARIDVCETSGCEGDPVPPHDRVGGNIPLEFALRLIAEQGSVAKAAAHKLLEEN